MKNSLHEIVIDVEKGSIKYYTAIPDAFEMLKTSIVNDNSKEYLICPFLKEWSEKYNSEDAAPEHF